MLGLGWGEMLVLATVAILVVGPKDLPKMLRSIGRTVKSVRSVAGDFQRQFSEAIDEIDDDGTMRAAANPMKSVKSEIDAVKEDFDLGWMDDDGPRKSAEAAVKKRVALDEAMSAEASKAAAKPAARKTAAKKASAKKPAAAKSSAAKKPTAKKSAANKPAAKKPATKKPTAQKPRASKSKKSQPAGETA